MTTDELRSLAAELASPAVDGYLQRPLPDELDDRVGVMLKAYREGSTSARSEITRILGLEQSFGLLAYAERMTILGVRLTLEDALANALLAIVVEGLRWDARESLPILALINNSAEKLGAQPGSLFEEAAGIASPAVAHNLRVFLAREPSEKAIGSMGYSEVSTPEGFNYVRNW